MNASSNFPSVTSFTVSKHVPVSFERSLSCKLNKMMESRFHKLVAKVVLYDLQTVVQRVVGIKYGFGVKLSDC